MQRMLRQMSIALIMSSVGLAAFPTRDALANGTDYNDGPVVNVSAIRTVDGHFDDYMHWLSTTWKKQEEAAKKAGLVVAYHVYTAEPHGPNDPDIYLVVGIQELVPSTGWVASWTRSARRSKAPSKRLISPRLRGSKYERFWVRKPYRKPRSNSGP